MATIDKKPKVSVCVVTYNHEQYIEQCLQSIVDQSTAIDFEIIVGVDHSKDRTANIVKLFVERYPTKIRAVFHEKQVGATNNYKSVHSIAKGQFVAHIDGDDLMCSDKIEKQVNILDSNSGISVVTHPVYIVKNNLVNHDKIFPLLGNNSTRHTLKYALKFGSLAAHSSMMYRRDRFNVTMLGDGEQLDFYIFLKLLESGDNLLIPDVLGCYRIQSESTTNSLNFDKYFCKIYLEYINKYPELHPYFFARALGYILHSVTGKQFPTLQMFKLAVRSFTFSWWKAHTELRDYCRTYYKALNR